MLVATGPVCWDCGGEREKDRRDPKTRLLRPAPCPTCKGWGRTGEPLELEDA